MRRTAPLPPAESYEDLVARFTWRIPPAFTIAEACCDRWADGSGRTALINLLSDARTETITFDALRRVSTRFANLLAGHGLTQGDRVGILPPQGVEAAAAHLAAYRLGAVAVPLFQLFGPDALEFRLRDSGAVAVITDDVGLAKLEGIPPRLPALGLVLDADGARPGALSLWEEAERARDDGPIAPTSAEDPALIIYTSGTTGAPKGGVAAAPRAARPSSGRRVAAGDVPPSRRPLLDTGRLGLDRRPSRCAAAIAPSRRAGACAPHAEIRSRGSVSPHGPARGAQRLPPPTALRPMRQVPQRFRFGHRLRSIGSGDETLGAETLEWGRGAFGLTINEFYVQTECNLVVANCAGLVPVQSGSMGRPVPGHEDDDVITSAGYRIGSGEVEDCLLRHPAVVLAAVVGLPDPIRTGAVTAVRVLREGVAPSRDPAAGIQDFVRARLAAHCYPRRIVFAPELPMTATGKVRRGELRAALGSGGAQEDA